jgi:hypothetical protein
MKKSIIIILTVLLTVTAIAQTITVETVPAGLPIYYRGELLGKSPVVIPGPFAGTVSITVMGKEIPFGADIVAGPDMVDKIAVISDTVREKGINWWHFIAGVGISIGVYAAVNISIFALGGFRDEY